jgi:hypothetical protein
MGQGGLELTKPLEGQSEIVVGFGIFRIGRQPFFVLDHRIGDLATAAENIGEMESGRGVPFVERDSHLELATGVSEIAYPNEGRPKHHMVFGRLTGDIGCLTDQVAGLAGRTKLATNHGQSTKSKEMTRPIGENPSIGLFGDVQGGSTGNGRCRRSDARPVGESRFAHGRAAVRSGCANARCGVVRLGAAKAARQRISAGIRREQPVMQIALIN